MIFYFEMMIENLYIFYLICPQIRMKGKVLPIAHIETEEEKVEKEWNNILDSEL